MAIFLSQQGGGSGGPLNAIAAAAETTEHEPGGHAAVHALITSPDGKRVSMTGTMVFDRAGRVSGVFDIADPKTKGRSKMSMVGDKTGVYISSSLFGALPGGAKWMKIDLPGGAPSSTSDATPGSAAEGLKLLETVEGVETVGTEEVRGVPTTRYRGTTGRTDKPLRVEAWIDADGRVRRMSLAGSLSGQGEEASPTTDMRVDYFGFGPVPAIKVPDASEVFDGTALGES